MIATQRQRGPGVFSRDGAIWAATLALGLLAYWWISPASVLQWPPDWPGLLVRGLIALAALKLLWLDGRGK